jgi:hypothetical protein
MISSVKKKASNQNVSLGHGIILKKYLSGLRSKEDCQD